MCYKNKKLVKTITYQSINRSNFDNTNKFHLIKTGICMYIKVTKVLQNTLGRKQRFKKHHQVTERTKLNKKENTLKNTFELLYNYYNRLY